MVAVWYENSVREQFYEKYSLQYGLTQERPLGITASFVSTVKCGSDKVNGGGNP
jgi:hypothetical protein